MSTQLIYYQADSFAKKIYEKMGKMVSAELTGGIYGEKAYSHIYLDMKDNLELMKMDFFVFKKQVRVLKSQERNTVERFYGDGVDLRTLAEEQVIDYDSVRKRLRQARTHLKNNMFIYWEGTKRRAI